jgi:hypothetical protein
MLVGYSGKLYVCYYMILLFVVVVVVVCTDLENKLKEVPANGVMVLMFSCIAGAMIG